MLDYPAYNVTLDPEKTRLVLSGINARMGKTGGYPHAEVFYEGQWMSLGRTSLIDDVSTWNHDCDCLIARDLVAHYRDAVRLGARIRDGQFDIIDQVSDG